MYTNLDTVPTLFPSGFHLFLFPFSFLFSSFLFPSFPFSSLLPSLLFFFFSLFLSFFSLFFSLLPFSSSSFLLFLASARSFLFFFIQIGSSRPVVAPSGRDTHWKASTTFIAITHRGTMIALVVALLTARI
ncbi:hypothetical protein ACOSP7_006898 [Xanthoceras sorbifolium]